MKLIKKLGRKTVNDYKISFGLFLCPYCEKKIERQLSNGKRQKSCGCMKSQFMKGKNNHSYKHGLRNTRLYRIWNNMKTRCYNSNHSQYIDYGGRGIQVCNEWRNKENGLINFYNWATKNGYDNDLEINRIDNDGNYEPENCNFVTREENLNNRRDTVPLETKKKIKKLYNTGNYTQEKLAEKYSVCQATIWRAVNEKT